MSKQGYRRFVKLPIGADCDSARSEDLYCSCGEAVRVVGEAGAVEAWVKRWKQSHVGFGHVMQGRKEFERVREGLARVFGWRGNASRRKRRGRHSHVKAA